MSWAIEQKDYSQRGACAHVGLAPKVYRYRRRSDDGVLRTRLKALAAQRRRFGYRRLHLLLRREGFTVNHKKLFPHLPGGAARRSQARRPQARARHAGAGDRAARQEPALVVRLRVGHVHGWASLPHPGDRR